MDVYNKYIDSKIESNDLTEIADMIKNDIENSNARKLNNIKNKVIKTYGSVENMQNDETQIMLRDLLDNDGNKINIFEFMYAKMQQQLGSDYTGHLTILHSKL